MTSVAIVDLSAFAHNVRHLQSVVAPAELMVILKADAYGHGVAHLAQAAVAAGARRLGVLDITSGLAVRAAGIGRDVTVMAWQYLPGQDFAPAIREGIDLGVSQRSELSAIAAQSDGAPARIHLKIDTGLNRNGATAQEWASLVTFARTLRDEGRVEIYGVWSHIAEASEEDDTDSLRRFTTAIEVARELGVEFAVRHLAASSAGLRREDVRFDMVRMGGHCWGIPSFDGVTPADLGLIPVMTLRSAILSFRRDQGARTAVVPIGHADGIPFRAANRVDVTIGGRRMRVRNVYANSLEIAADADMSVGDEVVLFGNGESGEQTVREWGDLTDTLGDEIVARIGKGIPRRYIGT